MSIAFKTVCPYCHRPAKKISEYKKWRVYCCKACNIVFHYPNLSKEAIEGGTVSERSR